MVKIKKYNNECPPQKPKDPSESQLLYKHTQDSNQKTINPR